jgi:hypothetical protein
MIGVLRSAQDCSGLLMKSGLLTHDPVNEREGDVSPTNISDESD